MKTTDQELSVRFQIIERASNDADFRQRLLTEPRDAIKADFGILIADGAEISVIEDAPQNVTIVLPNRAADETAELDEVVGFARPQAAGIPGMSIFARNVETLGKVMVWQPAPTDYAVTCTEGGK